MNDVICRLVEDDPYWKGYENGTCGKCQQPIFVEQGISAELPKICIHCAEPNAVIFVSLPPDEFGGRSMAKSVGEVLAAGEGNWHKNGEWHSAQWALK